MQSYFLFSLHMKLELPAQFPASNDKKYRYLWKRTLLHIALSDWKTLKTSQKRILSIQVTLHLETYIYTVPIAQRSSYIDYTTNNLKTIFKSLLTTAYCSQPKRWKIISASAMPLYHSLLRRSGWLLHESTALKTQKEVSAYLWCKQILHFVFARQDIPGAQIGCLLVI